MATVDDLAISIADIKVKVSALYQALPVTQQSAQQEAQAAMFAKQEAQQFIQNLQSERQMITQLQMEGYTKDEAIIYYSRMQKGEKPWLDPPGFQVDGKTKI